MKKTLIFAVLILFIATGATYASTIAVGVTVDAIGSSSTVGIKPAPGEISVDNEEEWIKYFIPLSGNYSGIYGVDAFPGDSNATIGTKKDYGSGYSPDALTMFIKYWPVEFPAATAILTFEFLDLDLIEASDPEFFLEAIQIFNSDGDPVTDPIDDISDSNGDFSITVNLGEVSITIPDFTSSVLSNPTYAKLVFSSNYDDGNKSGWNTPEYLYTTLETSPVPIPGAVWLLGSGLLGLAGIRRKLRG